MAKELKDTLNLPKTAFPMRGNLANREPTRFQYWDEQGVYIKTLKNRPAENSFILHDGPPYANGNIHMGHALNKILKDFVIRFQSMQGKHAPYVPGWDCHGLPIEQHILRNIGDKIHDMEPLELRRMCHDYAVDWIDRQRDQFKRLGIMGDWDKPYMTVDPRYEAGILKTLHRLVEKGLIRKGHKAVHWDWVFRTALAEAEIEYHSHKSPSIYVSMPLKNPDMHDATRGLEKVSFVIWTTTPWTIPANLGITLHPEFTYAAVKDALGNHFIVAEGLANSFIETCEVEGAEIVRKFKAESLERATAEHPLFPDQDSLVMLGEHVTLEQGTGCVHTAPGHGTDDFLIGQAYNLPVFCPVDDKGCYTEDFPAMAGMNVFKANPKVVDLLRKRGCLLGHHQITHDYPYSWRSKEPIIFRATEQWFMELADGGIREQALEIIDQDVTWIPHWGKERIRSMVERRPEWCISRQRHWGVPIPAIRSRESGDSILDQRIIARFIEIVSEKGTDAWYSEPLEAFLPENFVYEPTGESSPECFEKEFDILDVWFDSGASHVAVLEEDERLHSPADLYLEGSDQHRGWFQSALLTSVGVRGRAPFKNVLTHGFVLDGEGRAMSKSSGNVISPLELIEQYGSDILRLWVASTDYRNDVAISPEIMKITADTYRSIRNTFRFQIGNLDDFNYSKDALPPQQLLPLDRWALHQLAELIRDVTSAYEAYEFHRVYQLINRFYAVTLSARYHDFLKDRLYTYAAASRGRRSAQTVIYHQLHALTRMLAPILVFTADEAHAFSEFREEFGNGSVHLEDWPTPHESWFAPETGSQIDELLNIRDKVNDKLEALREAKEIGKSVEASVTFNFPPEDSQGSLLEKYSDDLAEIFIVSEVNLNKSTESESLSIHVRPAEGYRCPRCWRTVNEENNTSYGVLCNRCAEAVDGASI